MSGSVDNRIVEMQFNNQRFEQNIHKSISSLDNLKESLNLESSVKSFEQLDSAAKTFNMNPMISAIQGVGAKFSALEVIAITALSNITTAAMNAGKNLIKSLTIDQISAGFNKYAQKTEAVQTIMNATGKSIDEVSVVLEKLNKYTDETSYSFSDMVSSIGKFTSAGVDLEVAEKAMEGIANWAATAGVGPERAASAFYNLSQAMSAGSLKMIDWKSINLLNMGTKQFKETAIETAVALGKLKKGQDGVIKTTKGLEVDYKKFDSTLSEGWFDMDVMLSVFEKYSDTTQEFGLRAYKAAQEAKTFKDAIEAVKDAVSTSWMNTFELIFGNYDEARVLWTNLANELIEVFTASAEKRNELLREWHDTGGYEAMIEAIGNAWEGLKGILESVKQGFSQIVPPMTAEKLVAFSERLRDLTAGFRDLMAPVESVVDDFEMFVGKGHGSLAENANESFSELTSTGKKLKSIFTGFLSIFDLVGQAFASIGRALSPLGSRLLKLGGHVFDAAASFGVFLTNLANTARNTKFFDKAVANLGNKIESLKTKFTNFLSLFIDFENLEMHLPSWDDINKFLQNPLEGIKSAFDSAKQSISGFFASIKTWFSNFTGIKIEAPDLSGFIDLLKNTNLFDAVSNMISKVYSAVKTVLSDIGSLLKNALTSGDLSALLDTFNKGFISGLILSITGAFTRISTFFKNLGGGFGIYSGAEAVLDGLGASLNKFKASVDAKALLASAMAIGLLAVSVKMLGSIDVRNLTFGLMALGSILMMAMASMKSYVNTMSTANVKNVAKGVTSMLAMAVSMSIMASAIKKISGLNWGDVAKGLVAIVVSMKTMSSAIGNMSSSTVAKAGGTMIAMGLALVIIAGAAKIFASMEWEDLGKAGAAIGGIMLIMGLFANLTKSVDFSGVGGSMIAMGIALTIFAANMKIISSMSWEELGKAGAGMLGIFAIIAAFSLLTKTVDFSGLGASMIAFGIAMIAMSAAMKIIGSMEWTSVLTAVLALAAVFAIIGGFSALTQNLNLGGTAASLLLFSAAILVFASAMAILGSMSWSGIGKGLVAIVAAFAILGLVALILAPVITVVIALSAALLLIGAAALAFGVGVSFIIAAFTTLAAIGAAGAAAIVVALDALVDGLITLAPKVGMAVVALIYAITSTLAGSAVAIGASLLELLVGMLDAISTFAGPLVDAGTAVLLAFGEAFRVALPALAAETALLFIDFFNTIADTLRVATPLLLAAFGNIMSAIIEFILSAIQALVENIPGVGDQIAAELEGAKGAVRDFFAGDQEAQAEAREYLEAMREGVEDGGDGVKEELQNVVDESQTAIEDNQGEFVEAGAFSAQGVVDGISLQSGALYDAGAGMGEEVLAGFKNTMAISSPSKVMGDQGYFTVIGLVKNGITDNLWRISKAGELMANTLYNNFQVAAEYAKRRIEGDETFTPHIIPILDMSGVEAGMNSVNGLVNSRTKMMASIDAKSVNNSDEIISVASKILRAVQNGSTIYFDDGQFAGRLNRRLGAMI